MKNYCLISFLYFFFFLCNIEKFNQSDANDFISKCKALTDPTDYKSCRVKLNKEDKEKNYFEGDNDTKHYCCYVESGKYETEYEPKFCAYVTNKAYGDIKNFIAKQKFKIVSLDCNGFYLKIASLYTLLLLI